MKGRLESQTSNSRAQFRSPDEGQSAPGDELETRRGGSGSQGGFSGPTSAPFSRASEAPEGNEFKETLALERIVRRMRMEECFSLPQIARILGLALPVVRASLLRGMRKRPERRLSSFGHAYPPHRWRRAESPTDTLIGRTLSHYRVLSVLGRGGMGVVYRAFDSSLDREVALKVPHTDRSRDAKWRRRLLQEARTAASLASQQTCVVYEVGEADGTPFLAMELVRGQRLQDVLQWTSARGSWDLGSALPVGRALELAAEIARGVARIHALGYVHCDLKPSNIMVTESGHARIIDFGLAIPLEHSPSPDSGVATPAGDLGPVPVWGTPSYMSPEQTCGVAVDQRSDIFTFGVLLHEMLTGANPFRRRTHAATQEAILKDPVGPLRLPLASKPTSRLQRTLEGCLAKMPKDRYRDMHEVVVELERARDETRICLSNPSFATRPVPQWVFGFLFGVASLMCALSFRG